MRYHDRLTERTESDLADLAATPAGRLTFNELLAVAGVRLATARENLGGARRDLPADADLPALAQDERYADAGRDISIAQTALEDALTRYNSARYRIAGVWKRADPDARA